MSYLLRKGDEMPTEKIKDKEDNTIFCYDLGDKINLFLKLKSEPKDRLMGTVYKKKRVFFCVRKPSKHVFKTGGKAIAFNEILLDANTFDFIHLKLGRTDYSRIPLCYLREHGSYRFFKQQGFELQKFYTLRELAQFKNCNK